jgi:hypothetical protein
MNKRRRIGLAKPASVAMLGLGAATLLLAIFYNSTLLTFVGLGLAFWGAVLLYARPERYARQAVLDVSVAPMIEALNQMIRELDYRGDPVYLPPKYFEDPENTKIYVPKQRDADLPTPEQIQKPESQLFTKTPRGMLLTPPGAELVNLFEEKLQTSFTRTDLKYLERNLPKLLIEDLEIAEDMQIDLPNSDGTIRANDAAAPAQTKNSTVHVKITTSTYNRICKETAKTPSSIGCPLCSAIACAIAKASGKPVTIEETKIDEDGKTIETSYSLLEEQAK